MLMMSFSYFSGSFFHEATNRSPGRFLDEAIWGTIMLTFSVHSVKIAPLGDEMIQRHKAHPDQAGFFRRFLAFTIDFLVIMLISVVVYFSISEIAAKRRGEKGEFSRMLDAIGRGESVVVGLNKNRSAELERKSEPGEKTFYVGGEKFNIVSEFIVGYIYYILFFRFGGRTIGKLILRLRVIDLEGRPRLGWYQSLERAHGYAASALLAFLGFLQVLWDHKGLTMHDRLAGTTVIRLKKTPRRHS
jgi:uncharacterized RDD family membrane protein YckC